VRVVQFFRKYGLIGDFGSSCRYFHRWLGCMKMWKRLVQKVKSYISSVSVSCH